ncbi:hypothetical protein [Desulfuromonas thiophila]|uniref:Uncharacterized protein n=1 Tax=Desulfuromonas thiophila TaxID=57664 RepID=A0A1G7B556_9BACT|nr:hypothetical protein [Desulfuromonas thiophila]SDE22219.1 hypothetical protein SAMN05661003_10570 [Desulfuromonas thiophila]
MKSYENVLGYMKYSGKLVDDGFLDARKAASALLGFDEALRHFVRQDFPDLDKYNYEIPVKIRKGSWEALIPENIGQWIMAGAGFAATAYASAAAAEMAKNDFKDASIKQAFVKAIKSVQWFIKICKHLGHSRHRKFEKVKFKDNNNKIGIPNEEMEYLFVPKEYLDAFSTCSSKILEELAIIIEKERQLTFGVSENGSFLEETISYKDKYIFYEEEQDEVLFPELTHGQYVQLEGDITRGNENANNLGFRYDGHILTIIPASGSIVRHKNALFLKCLVKGRVSRMDRAGYITEKRPKIIFTEVAPLEADNQDLFK